MSDTYKDAPPEMDFFRDPANYVVYNYYVKGVTFNHVAIVSQGIRNGVANSLPSVLKADEVQTHTTTFDNISQYSLIQDRNKLQVVAILFNTKTNAVENAAVCNISKNGDDSVTSIQHLNKVASSKTSVIYDVMGRKVNNMKTPGVYIVNGKKIVVK